MPLDNVLARLDANLPEALERLFELLRIPSISTDPQYANDCQTAADWLVEDLKSIGIDASARPTNGHPMVVGHADGPGRHVLFYGHYDVQPVDPLELWDAPPFEPALEDTPKGKVIRGRGTADDKGQLMTFVEACRAWKAETGSLPCKLTFLFEGEEESGSPSLVPFMEENADELKADLALICDTSLFDPKTPAITTMLRGLLGEEIIVRGPSLDLHSGTFGGAARNPARVLTKILGALHDEDGRVTVEGFYEGVEEISDELREQWSALDFDETAFLQEVGLGKLAGETGRTALEMLWARPTCEINGMISGYTGEGFKTVLPAEARAKVSFRLVGQQDPLRLRDSFRAGVRAQIPEDCSVEFISHGAGGASVMDTSDPAFEAARQALSDEWPNEAAFVGSGGSIPIAGHFNDILGMNSMLIGFSLDDDQLHSPNEKYNLESFHKGARSWARVLEKLAK